MNDLFSRLVKKLKRIGALSSIGELLEWDQYVMMPPAAVGRRSLENVELAALKHELFTDSRMSALLYRLQDEDLTEGQRALVREVAHDYDREVSIPQDLVAEFARVTTKADGVWTKARAENDFVSFAPTLKNIIGLSRERANYIDSSADPYEVLFQDYESGMTLNQASEYLEKIKVAVVPLCEQLAQKSPMPRSRVLESDVPGDKVIKFSEEIAKIIGYDFGKGRLDLSTHPFTSAFGRITTRLDDGWWMAISSTIHEAGHGMYEHNLPKEYFGTPLGEPRSMSIHESQSRLWENHIGKSTVFWGHNFLKLIDMLGLELAGEDFTPFISEIHRIEPGFIRVNADEVTYPLHIIVRFEIEQELILGQLDVEDLPEAWNQKMRDYLGLDPPTDTVGCLQDCHWAWGCFGYFPTYALGSMIAAQLFAAAQKDIIELRTHLNRDSCRKLNEWLKEKIHRHGRRYSTLELVRRATGKFLSVADYTQHLRILFNLYTSTV